MGHKLSKIIDEVVSEFEDCFLEQVTRGSHEV